MKPWYFFENDEELEAGLKRFQEIKYAKSGDDLFKEKKLLAFLISDYQEKNSTLPEVDPIEYIKARMEDFDYKLSDLAKAYGDKGTVSKVLNYKQPLSLNMIRAFSELLRIPPELLMKEYPLKNKESISELDLSIAS